MTDQLKSPDRQDAQAFIHAKLIELVRMSAEHGIRIDALMYKALEFCDAEPPFSR